MHSKKNDGCEPISYIQDDFCVCCGTYIGEGGGMVCGICRDKVLERGKETDIDLKIQGE